ncbi:hypothetical protein T265_12147 [Opisthorchis viverrini]|uniref:Uncharacterized protein n=1 Tax=Opisthorchis viverrini TaxID=6198 RepID=A0A074ZUC1_OPIVI|nr:hypothetical protein T265_12147 [Opisthorchis viverrini]KER18799.1 hypothetical protein T265_12147 [Opisthorchis viverrini]
MFCPAPIHLSGSPVRPGTAQQSSAGTGVRAQLLPTVGPHLVSHMDGPDKRPVPSLSPYYAAAAAQVRLPCQPGSHVMCWRVCTADCGAAQRDAGRSGTRAGNCTCAAPYGEKIFSTQRPPTGKLALGRKNYPIRAPRTLQLTASIPLRTRTCSRC